MDPFAFDAVKSHIISMYVVHKNVDSGKKGGKPTTSKQKVGARRAQIHRYTGFQVIFHEPTDASIHGILFFSHHG